MRCLRHRGNAAFLLQRIASCRIEPLQRGCPSVSSCWVWLGSSRMQGISSFASLLSLSSGSPSVRCSLPAAPPKPRRSSCAGGAGSRSGKRAGSKHSSAPITSKRQSFLDNLVAQIARNRARDDPMSALPPKADVCGATSDVRFGPIADIIGHSIIGSARACSEPRGIAKNCLTRGPGLRCCRSRQSE